MFNLKKKINIYYYMLKKKKKNNFEKLLIFFKDKSLTLKQVYFFVQKIKNQLVNFNLSSFDALRSNKINSK